MLEGVVSRNKAPLFCHHLLIVESLLGQKSIFLTLHGINGSLADPGRAPILRTKSVTKKMNKSMAEIEDSDGIRTNDLVHQKANTIPTELKRILFSSVVIVLAFRPGVPGSIPVQILYFRHAFIHLFLCFGLCS